jgi:DNA-binding transcriptional regulator LsrR (DeoR family)
VEDNAASIKEDKYISKVLRMAENVDYTLIGIGNIRDSQLLSMQYISDEDIRNIEAAGAEGELMGDFFTIDGKKIKTGLENRIIAVDMPMKCPVIAVAGGAEKVNAIVSVLRSGMIQGLVIDEKTAQGVLKILNDGKETEKTGG